MHSERNNRGDCEFVFIGSVAASLRKANCRNKSVMFCSVATLSLGGSADGERTEKMSHC
jgi:hypothetical protein